MNRAKVRAIWHRNPALALFAAAGLLLAASYAVFPSPDALSRRDVARIAEFRNLQQQAGELIYPGFGSARIPLALTKGKREYLFDHPAPPAGYEAAAAGSYSGRVAQRRGTTLPRLALTAWPVAEVPTVFLPAKGTVDEIASLMDLGGNSSVLEAAMSGGAGTIGTEGYVLVAIHEAFHAFQQMEGDLNRLQSRLEREYGSNDDRTLERRLREAEAEVAALLKEETEHLASALEAETLSRRRVEAASFLAAREARRRAVAAAAEGLSLRTVQAYESQYEWLEGMARYAEHRAVEVMPHARYQPLPETLALPDFHGYPKTGWLTPAKVREAQRLQARPRSAVTGAAICLLLDHLGADWKGPAMKSMASPEDLLRKTLAEK